MKSITVAQFENIMIQLRLTPGTILTAQQLYEFANAAFRIGYNADVAKSAFKEKKV